MVLAALGSVYVACGPPLDPHAPHAPGTFMCADGDLPCGEQIRSLRCDTVTKGMLVPDIDEVRWLFQGAKVPQRQTPPVSLVSWCTGSIDVEGTKMEIELFREINGGYLRPPGSDRIWFQTPPEESTTLEARMCVGGLLPAPESIAIGACESVSAEAPPNLQALQQFVGKAHVTDHRTWTSTEPEPWCSCETRIGAERRRIDLYDGHRGIIRLPDERRLCFAW